MTIAWSCGGGIQSVAIGVLIKEGVLERPDFSGIADTGREMQSTWDYLRGVLQPYLDPVGVKIEVVPHALARVDLYDKSGLTLVPAYTAEGRLSAFCSGEWKRDVMERWLRSKGVKSCVQWLGFSLDELRRCARKPHRPWCVPGYPLIDKRLTRGACERIILAAGLSLPKKSRCWMCPHQNDEEWAEVKASPAEWAKACELDAAIRESDPEGRGKLFLHPQRVPLSVVELSPVGGMEDYPLFRDCQEAGCWT